MRKEKFKVIIASISILIAFVFVGASIDDGSKFNKTNNVGTAYIIDVNKLKVPLNDRGVIANVSIGGIETGIFDDKTFLFSGGFFIGGKQGSLVWAEAVASASRVQDFLPGTWQYGSTDPRNGLYVLKSTDPDFGESWQQWKKAVELGADYYDGDKDGSYNPVDKNGNGVWDRDEDRPDLLGDETVWCVYHDGVRSADRRWNAVTPKGIEIRQTVWAYAAAGDLGNILFVRYKIRNTGGVFQTLDNVYFGVWADPDLGAYGDDLVGCDTLLNAGYVYNAGPDAQYGSNPPCFLIDFFQGPIKYTGNQTDLAFDIRGTVLGIDTITGAINEGLSSFVHYMQSHQTQGDPNNEIQAYNYLEGKNMQGNFVDPCNWEFGVVVGGVDCAKVNKKFMYSGDPVARKGWLNKDATDQRQMQNTGPFKLTSGERDQVIIAAYIVGRSTDNLKSVKEAKRISRFSQVLFDNNFNVPTIPQVKPQISTSDDAIYLYWETADFVNLRKQGIGYDVRFHGFEVTMYNSFSTAPIVNGMKNSEVIARYRIDNNYKVLLYEDEGTGQRTIVFDEGNYLLDTTIYGNPQTGRILLKIDTDPFTGSPLIKGKPYFISVQAIGVNYPALELLEVGTYLIPRTATIGLLASAPRILPDEPGKRGIILNPVINDPVIIGKELKPKSGVTDAKVYYSIIDKSKLTGDKYKITFTRTATTAYNVNWNVINVSKNLPVLSNQSVYDTIFTNVSRELADGILINVKYVEPKIKGFEYKGQQWFKKPDNNNTGIFYVGSDAPVLKRIAPISSSLNSNAIKITDRRQVEIRFGKKSKAYRYFQSTPISGFRYSGFVEVPFQAWVKDQNYKEERQLAVAFTETAVGNPGTNDSVYNPSTDIKKSKEYIFVFNTTYSETADPVYTGGSVPNWRIDQAKTTAPPEVTDPAKQAIAKSPYFDAMYVIGLERPTFPKENNFNPSGELIIKISYPLSESVEFEFESRQPNAPLTFEEQKELFDRVNVYPNPLFAYNPDVGYTGGRPDDPYVTFINLPQKATIKIYSLSGNLMKTIEKDDNNTYIRWNLKNENDLRVASGLYIALITSPGMKEKILKFSIIMPQKQIQYY